MGTRGALRKQLRASKAWLVLTILLAAPTAGAEPECIAPIYVWDLELTRVERLSGAADPNVVASSLGRVARLRGGYHDPANPRVGPRADLMGSDEGAGLHVTLEKREP
jgi:hypothetical protein